MQRYIMALDQGTTSSRAIIFDQAGDIVTVAQRALTQHYPQPGWVEHDAMEIWSTQIDVARAALRQTGLSWRNIAAVGITNQRETTVVWDKATGEPIAPAIVWQCRRTAAFCEELLAQGYGDAIRRKTGLLIDAYFSASKIKWLLDNVAGARQRAERGELLFGTVDTWLIWQLTKGAVHCTDVSNASRTMLFNIRDLAWDDELLKLFSIPRAILPQVTASSTVYGETAPEMFGGPIPIAGAAGDQQAALFGQVCFAPGTAKNTYGTGCFMLLNTGTEIVDSQHGLLTTIAWQRDGQVTYALEGSVFVAGAVIQWLRDELGLLDSVAAAEDLARAVPDTQGIYLVPAFVGLGAPYWDSHARGVITGLTRGVNKNHLVRAALESMAYQTADVLQAMTQDAGIDLVTLKVDGGASANDFLMQFQADIIGGRVERPHEVETTALGAAYLAGLAVGYWRDEEEIAAHYHLDRVFTATMPPAERTAKRAGWAAAVRQARA